MKGDTSFFLKGILLIVVLVSVSLFLAIYSSFLDTWAHVSKSVEYRNKANDLLNLLLNSPECLALNESLLYQNVEIDPSETRIISKDRLDLFTNQFKDIEPVCARDFNLRYKVTVEKSTLGRLAVPPKKVPEPGDRDIVIVFDSSKSMDGDRIDASKKALIKFLKCADETDRVALVSYGEVCNTTIISDFKELTPENKIELADKISQAIKAESGTPLIDSLITAIDLMTTNSTKEKKMIVFMTDGRESCCRKCLTEGPSCTDLMSSPPQSGTQDKECDPGRQFCQSYCQTCRNYVAGVYSHDDRWECKECKEFCGVGNFANYCYPREKFLGSCLCRQPCNNELCDFAKTLTLSYPIITVGFLVDSQGEKELQCVADNNNGAYFYGNISELEKLFCEIAGGTFRVKELPEIWTFGVNTSSPPNALYTKFESSTSASIKFENKTQPAIFKLTLYYGELETMSNLVDQVCFSGNSLTYNMKLSNPTYSKIDQNENFVCQTYKDKEYCQKVYCQNIDIQTITPGNYILSINYDRGGVVVRA